MLVGMDNDPGVHAVHGGISAADLDRELLGRNCFRQGDELP
jgi:hypothetical protein